MGHGRLGRCAQVQSAQVRRPTIAQPSPRSRSRTMQDYTTNRGGERSTRSRSGTKSSPSHINTLVLPAFARRDRHPKRDLGPGYVMGLVVARGAVAGPERVPWDDRHVGSLYSAKEPPPPKLDTPGHSKDTDMDTTPGSQGTPPSRILSGQYTTPAPPCAHVVTPL